MSTFTMAATVPAAYDDVVAETRAALADQGFGVLTEIDVRATMAAKLGVEVPAEVILGACRPELAHRAMTAAPSIAALLPCNVVVRATGEQTTVVEVVDPETMVQVVDATGPTAADLAAVTEVAADARQRLARALDALTTRVGA